VFTKPKRKFCLSFNSYFKAMVKKQSFNSSSPIEPNCIPLSEKFVPLRPSNAVSFYTLFRSMNH
jgi:hypothetical protein